MQAAGHFTPDQLIIAGRRAEQQGNLAYALQFYRHLAEVYPSSAEAFEARDALFRLAPGGIPGGGAPQPVAASAPPTVMPANGPRTSASAHDMTLRTDARGTSRAERPTRRSTRSDAKAIEPAYRGHRIGRFVAMMLGTMGWLLLIGSIAAGPAIAAALLVKSVPKGLRETVAGNLPLFVAGTVGCLFLGLFAVFAGQVARAMFDTADLTRWMAAHMSNQNGSDHH